MDYSNMTREELLDLLSDCSGMEQFTTEELREIAQEME